ncbi:MAG TPA: cell division protein FtsW, partial [Rhodobacterales bacterium]|nr:cell division protein FtsW [Rhodobacterales bacterium]
MTEMVYGALPKAHGDPILPRWWRTIDKVSVACILILFGIGLLLGFAASPPLAERNGLSPFYYVQRQALFGGLAVISLFATTMIDPRMVRRLAVIGFALFLVAVMLLPF